MAIFKCKICGGGLEVDPSLTVAECQYCGTRQTLPRLDDERRANLYDRANHFRRNNDFDKAMGIYEQILNEDTTDAEAYWSLVLCRYGIEYVEDPATRKRVATVNRAQFTSIFDDEDYKSAIANADGAQREIYEAEAEAINEIQKGILAISQKEEPFDVFICYKETDNRGRRTQDSVLATELYHELVEAGFKVFFSRITLESKLGEAYEPYIFAALHSARVMVVLGTRPEHFNATWVKNEWGRYLALIKNGAKKTLIPAYRDMDPYDLPEEFSHLQAQDMSKLGFMQDLLHGIKKLLTTAEARPAAVETVVATAAAPLNISPLLDRAFLFLEDGEFDRADEFCEQVLNQDPKNAQAYLAKLMIDMGARKQEDLITCDEELETNGNYQKAIRFGDQKLADTLQDYALQAKYNTAKSCMDIARTEEDFQKAARLFAIIPNYKDSASLQKQCEERAKRAHLDAIYYQARGLMKQEKYTEAANVFARVPGYKDADAQAALCHEKKKELREKAIARQKDGIYETAKKEAAKNTSTSMKQAAKLFASIPGWRDADAKVIECNSNIQKLKRLEKKKNLIILFSILTVIIIAIVSIALYQNLVVNIERDGVQYQKVGDNYEIVAYSGSATELKIPAEIKGKPVTVIRERAFADCTSLNVVTIPSNVKNIGLGAFSGCTGLTNIEIPLGVISIGNYAFHDCTGLTAITVPSSVTSIGDGAFNGCMNLESITLPFVGATLNGTQNTHLGYIFGTALYLNNYAYVPTSLKTVVITGGSSIGECAFNDCAELTSITIPSSVMSIDKYAFSGCTNLTSVHITDLSAWCKISFHGQYANPLSIAHNLYLNGNEITNLVIPEGVASIGDWAFFGCTNFTSVEIPSSVTSIGEWAFSFNENLTNITIPSNVTSIGRWAFSGCTKLSSVTIDNGVTSIGSYAFSGCTKLSSVTFETTAGWWCSSSPTATSGMSISASSLSNAATAATYLRLTYCNYYWRRN